MMQKNSEVIRNAEQWLILIDQGKITESWSAASSFFQSQITSSDWDAKISQVRGMLGTVLSRTVDDSQAYMPPEDVPRGDYVIVTFATDFENRSGAIETVTNHKRQDGSWAVVGYFIK